MDLQRLRRRGFPEVIYAQGKTPEQIAAIARTLSGDGQPVLVTRIGAAAAQRVRKQLPWLRFFPEARLLLGPGRRPIRPRAGPGRTRKSKAGAGRVLVMTAGTSDIPVAEEAAVTAQWMGHRVERLFDVGVAGLHRLLRHLPKVRRAGAIVVVAGMDGVLPSIVSGLTRRPVVAVPTSVGYGASFRGVGPLLTMLNSCSPGVAVVNIDNGFGAGYLAAQIASGWR